MGYYKWRPSKARISEFVETMNEIDEYCSKNGISQSARGDSYYFDWNGKHYRISNHSIESSKYHNDDERKDKNNVFIHASKTRLIEIHQKIISGKEVDGRGYIKY